MHEQRSLPLAYWGLDHWPFRGAVAASQFYPTAGHNEALARIEYLVESHRRLGVLLGDPGVGKSLVLKVAAAKLARTGAAVARVDSLGVTTRELLWQIATGLRSFPREDADTNWLWRQIADRVAENRLQQIASVILVDDAGQAGPDVTTQLVRLARLDTTPAARWTIVLAAETSHVARWSDTLRSAVDLRIELTPWMADDTIGYVQTALVDAGRIEPVFDDSALRALHELSAGNPRQASRLADYALLAGAAAKVELVDAGQIDAAYDEVAWPATAEAY